MNLNQPLGGDGGFSQGENWSGEKTLQQCDVSSEVGGVLTGQSQALLPVSAPLCAQRTCTVSKVFFYFCGCVMRTGGGKHRRHLEFQKDAETNCSLLKKNCSVSPKHLIYLCVTSGFTQQELKPLASENKTLVTPLERRRQAML